MARLFLDMDGTLAKFHDEVDCLERMWEKNFFKNLKPFPKMIEAVKLLKINYPELEIFILSAAIDGEPPYCQKEKNLWIDRYLPFIDKDHRIYTKIGHPKSEYIPGDIQPTDVLYDDYTENLLLWDGDPVKCRNNINCKGLIGPSWNGDIISNDESPYQITRKLGEIHLQLPHAEIVARNSYADLTLKCELHNGSLSYAGYKGTVRITEYSSLNNLIENNKIFKCFADDYISDDLTKAHLNGYDIEISSENGFHIGNLKYEGNVIHTITKDTEINIFDVLNEYEQLELQETIETEFEI